MSFLSRPNLGRRLVLRPSTVKPKKARGSIAAPRAPETVEFPLPAGPCQGWPGDDTVISAAVDAADWPDWTDHDAWSLSRNGCLNREEVSDARG